MLTTPLWVQLIHGFFTGSVSAAMGLVLVNIRPDIRKLLLSGLFYDLGVLVLWSLRLPFQVRFLILTALLTIIIQIIWKMGFFRTIVVTAMGTLLLGLGETIFLPLYIKALGVTINQILEIDILALFMSAPQIIMSFIIIAVCLTKKIHLFDFSKFVESNPLVLSGRRFKIVLGLVSSMVVLIILQALCNITVYTGQGINTFSLNTVGYVSNTVIMLVCIMAALLVVQLLELTQKESKYEIQSSYLETIEELYTGIRGQRHDLINHFQVLYGFLQMGNLIEVRKYLETLIGESVNSNNLVDTGSPGLSALLYIKSGIALSNGINFSINVEKQINDIGVSSYELNRIIGNLINNAFDYVMKLDEDKRVVNYKMTDNSSFYIFEVSNCGHIEEELKTRLFEKGFSTKKGDHSGLGLYIVKHLVTKYEGFIDVANQGDQVVFSLHLPRKKVEESDNALLGSKNSRISG
ncbi:MAG: GHKL domain-containing protein [Syntrophomonadaceae bacterium]|nr:GHKL domain-containing protein [Syntrophomonadaceae bacterium]